MIKRLFDVCFSGLGLIVLSPVMLFICVRIKLDSNGPVFFLQQRVGLNGRLFNIIKFRTMRVDAESLGLKVTVKNDPRITASGQFLRKTKLDELPQLINVLKGEMSLVGPRPEVAEYMKHYPSDVKQLILSVRPGMTDEASISFSNESELLSSSSEPKQTYIQEIMPIKAKFYVKYAQEHSVWGDIIIIIKTLRKIVA